eukprot:13117960-Ditylum_brightwellii.AAC.1
MELLDKDELLDILEFRVPASWYREFTIQGFDPVDQGQHKFVEFCTRLESCEPNEDKPKVEKPAKLREENVRPKQCAKRTKADTNCGGANK